MEMVAMMPRTIPTKIKWEDLMKTNAKLEALAHTCALLSPAKPRMKSISNTEAKGNPNDEMIQKVEGHRQ